MIKICHIACMALAVLCVAPSCTHGRSSSERQLRALDELVRNRQVYHRERDMRADSLRSMLSDTTSHYERFEIYGRLVETFRSYDLDSQQYYTEARLVMAQSPFECQVSLLNYSEVLMRSGMYHEAICYMDSALQQPLNPVLAPYYGHLRRTLYGLMADFAITRREHERYVAITQQYRDTMMAVHPAGTFLHELVRADYLYVSGLYDSALHVLSCYEQAHEVDGEDETAVFAITRAMIYHALGDTEHEKQQLILSAEADIRHAVREYISLRELAVLLYHEGDIDRAYRYMQCAVVDASEGSNRVRSIETNTLFPVVEQAYLKKEKQRQYWAMMWILAHVALIALLVLFLIYANRQRRKLATLNSRLEQSNSELMRSNHISTVYVGRYMEMASLLIDHFDEWRKQLKTLANRQSYDKLSSLLNSQRFTQEQLDTFYHDFDAAFLDIFPDFVPKVRALLVEDADLRIKNGEKLNTDLRVLALIRLGITDSRQIAGFLRYSLSTIYNSRTRMRNLAREDREHFEQQVADIR